MKLEDIIHNNREQFDEPISPLLWEKIQSRVPKKKPLWPQYIRYAAILLVVLGTGYLWGSKQSSTTNIGSVDQEIITYTQKINQKREHLGNLVSNQPDLQATFISDLEGLQTEFDYLQSLLPNNPNKNRIIEEMINNLQVQIEVLNQQTVIAEKAQTYL